MYLIFRVFLFIVPLLMLWSSVWFLNSLREDIQQEVAICDESSFPYVKNIIKVIDFLVLSTFVCRIIPSDTISQIILTIFPLSALILYVLLKRRLCIILTNFSVSHSFAYFIFLVFLVLTVLETWFIYSVRTLF